MEKIQEMGLFQGKVVVITGGAGGIGRCIGEEFRRQGAHICVIDVAEGDHFVGDLAHQQTLEAFAQTVIDRYGRVDVLVNNAPPAFVGIDNCSYDHQCPEKEPANTCMVKKRRLWIKGGLHCSFRTNSNTRPKEIGQSSGTVRTKRYGSGGSRSPL